MIVYSSIIDSEYFLARVLSRGGNEVEGGGSLAKEPSLEFVLEFDLLLDLLRSPPEIHNTKK